MHNIARKPCESCPYRQDVPSGVWDASEYDKLLGYDEDTAYQPVAVFQCHQQNGCLCRGWLDCHGSDLLSIRLALSMGNVDPDKLDEALDQEPAVPVFASGAEAAEHGKREIERVGKRAINMMNKIDAKRKRKGKQ